MNRFARQSILPGFGKEGQEKLTQARVLVVGAGGLGCPVLLHLAAAGVGILGIADGDVVSESNLNRQTLFGQQHIGRPKAETAAILLKEKYPDVSFHIIPDFLTAANALELIAGYDLVVDGSDNFGTRYMLNDACVLLNKPLVMGAIYQYEGQLTVLNYGSNPVNYRDLYAEPPQGNQVPNCSETGVLGVLPGTIGSLQATEAIKVITGLGRVLTNKMLLYNLKDMSFYDIALSPGPRSAEKMPGSEEAFRNMDYNISCGLAGEIAWDKALDWAGNMVGTALLDIREPGEEPLLERPVIRKLPMGAIRENPDQLKAFENILMFCRSGARSGQLAGELQQRFPGKKIFSVQGGVLHPLSPLNSNNK